MEQSVCIIFARSCKLSISAMLIENGVEWNEGSQSLTPGVRTTPLVCESSLGRKLTRILRS